MTYVPVSLFCGSVFLLSACSSTQSSSTSSVTAQAESCEPGSSGACYCSDGALSGTQACNAQGSLDVCQCPHTAPQSASDAAVSTQVCQQVSDVGNCKAEPHVSKQLPSSILFLVDKSLSMVCNLPPLQSSAACEQSPVPVDDTKPTKWKVIQQALADTFQTLPGTNALAGLSFFSVDGACGVDSKPSVELAPLNDVQRTNLTGALDGTRPNGQTPIVGATILAYAHLHQEVMAPGNRFVVLITDGAESCATDKISQLLDTEVKKAREVNIRTFVIGAPGSELGRSFLSELAFRGGTARSSDCVHDLKGAPDQGDCHLDMTKSEDFASALAAALGTVSSSAVGCDFPVPDGYAGGDVNVQYTPSNGSTPLCFAPDTSKPCEAGANGWQFAKNDDGTDDLSRVVVCGEACQKIKDDPGARVDILVGCAPVIF